MKAILKDTEAVVQNSPSIDVSATREPLEITLVQFIHDTNGYMKFQFLKQKYTVDHS